jgi:MscS family membrane protein
MNGWLKALWSEVAALVQMNEAWRFAALAICLLAAVLVGWLVRRALLAVAAKHAARPALAATLKAGARATGFILLVLGVKAGIGFLNLDAQGMELLGTISSLLTTLALAWLAYQLTDVASAWFQQLGQHNSRTNQMLVPLVRNSLRVVVVLLTLLQIATQLSGKPPSSLIAGLGVGGLAIALAAQETLKNLFGSMVLLADKPFEAGDVIRVDGLEGPVEHIGFRSTRLRTVEGFLATLPNGELANKTIVNIGKRGSIRRVITLSLPDDTPPAKMQRALAILKDVLHNHEGQLPDLPPRVHFSDITSSALTLQALYWYHPADQWAYMAFSEKVNLAILQQFAAAGIVLVAPTAVSLVNAPRPAPAG